MPGPICLVLLGVRERRPVAWSGALVMLAAVTGGLLVGDGRGDRLALAAVGWTLAAVFAGQLIAAQRERIVVERERRRLAEHQVVTDERLRIAQDLHDSVAHAMATINVQAGTAAHLLAHRPDQIDAEQLGAALTAIRAASGEVLGELSVLGLLRGSADDGQACCNRRWASNGSTTSSNARADGLSVR
jgi:signal transduction histidine kinase